MDQRPQRAESSFDGVLERSRPGEDGLEEGVHDGEEHQGAQDRVEEHPVDDGRHAVLLGCLIVGGGQDRVGPGGDFAGRRRRGQRWALPVDDLGEALAQLGKADAAIADHPYGRDAQGLSQGRHVEASGAPRELVGHGDHEAGGQVQGEGLGDEVHAALQRGGIDDDDQGVRGTHRGRGPGEYVVDDLLVGADRVQGVGAG